MKIKNFNNAWLVLIISTCMPAHAAVIEIPDVNLKYQPTQRHAYETVQLTSFNRPAIQESPVIDLTQLLKQEQSIVRLSNNSGNYSQVAFSIRGFGDNAVANSLILVDGFPLINPSVLVPNFNSIALTDIERLDITQGSEGVLWGDQAVGGVVNLITRHPEKKAISLNIGLGSFNKQYYNLFASGKFQHGVFLKAFGYTNRTENYRAHNDQNDQNLAAQVGRDYATGMVSANVQVYEDTIQFPGGLTLAEYNENPRQATNNKNFIHFKTPLIQLLNKQSLNDDWILETRLERQATDGNGFMYSDFNRKDILTMYRWRFIGNIHGYKIITGYEGQSSDYNFVNSMVAEAAQAQQNNLFARVTKSYFQDVEFIVGTRAAWQNNHVQPPNDDVFNALNKTMVAELGLAYAKGPWKYFLRRSGSFRFPKANEETWLPQGVDELKPQTGVSYETGGEIKTENQRFQINIYQLALLNEIAFNPTQTPENPFGSYANFPKTLRRGVTFTEDYRITEKLSLNGQFNVVDARFAAGEFSGHQIPAVPTVNANAGMSYALLSDWRVKYFATYNGRAYASKNDGNIGSKIPGYWINTAALQYEKKFYNVSLEVINLFNQKYSVYTLYDVNTNTNTYYPGQGRSIMLTFKVDI